MYTLITKFDTDNPTSLAQLTQDPAPITTQATTLQRLDSPIKLVARIQALDFVEMATFPIILFHCGLWLLASFPSHCCTSLSEAGQRPQPRRVGEGGDSGHKGNNGKEVQHQKPHSKSKTRDCFLSWPATTIQECNSETGSWPAAATHGATTR